VVVDAGVKENRTRPLFGVNGEVCSEKLKMSLTESALLEMSGKCVYQDLAMTSGLPTI
jgi:hypothetical protein